MISFKCKMCGGDLTFEPGASVAECPYCGTNQTLPKLDDDKRANLYDRANHFRRQNEFDKAMAIYEQVLAEDRTDAEAYWSLVLCRYGIEYVEDPASHKRVPTVNRVQYASILADEDYKSALAHADAAQRRVYEAEANAIAEIQKGILDISRKEAPFDVFICYKETDANGRRTPDSVLANDMYHQLTKEGFKVFFSRITLEDKIGMAYEPYIFAALNSAKVMVVLGTKPEYFNAVWVKNEWSRYLALIRGGADKTLVPAYRDMDPYDLPEEFAHLQAQDMGKLGFMQDLIRGIKKILHKDEPKSQTVAQPTAAAPANNVAPLLKRAFMFLEDGDFARADDFCEQVLNLDPENGRAYLGKLMVDLQVRRESDLKNLPQPFDRESNYQKIMRFGDEALKKQVQGDIEYIEKRNEYDRQKHIYDNACQILRNAHSTEQYEAALELFCSISQFNGIQQKVEECKKGIESSKHQSYNQAQALQKEEKWQEAIVLYRSLGDYYDSIARADECEEKLLADTYRLAVNYQKEGKWDNAIRRFEQLKNYRDSSIQAQRCRKAQEEERKAEEKRIEQEKQVKQAKEKAEATRRMKHIVIAVAATVLIIVICLLYTNVIKPNSVYNKGATALKEGRYDEATVLFEGLGDYKDAAIQAQECQYQKGLALMVPEHYDEATDVLLAMNQLEWDRTKNSLYRINTGTMGSKNAEGINAVEEAIEAAEMSFEEASRIEQPSLYREIVDLGISGYRDSLEMALKSQYQKGLMLRDNGNYDDATKVFVAINGYNDASTQVQESQYQKGVALLTSGDYDGATKVFDAISGYNDAASHAMESQYQKSTELLANGDFDGATAAFEAISGYSDAATQVKECQYQKGASLLSEGKYDDAITVFQSISEYRDAAIQVQESHYLKGLAFIEEGKPYLAFDPLQKAGREYKDVGDLLTTLEGIINKNAVSIAAGKSHTVILKSDGTVMAVGNNANSQCDTGDWTDIVAVTAGQSHTVGLKDDGTVIAVGYNSSGQIDTDNWKDIVAIAAGNYHTVGLKSDGTVTAVGSNDSGQCDTGNWKDIVTIAAGSARTVCLKSDGTVAAVGSNGYGQCDVSGWKDILAVAVGGYHTVGLKSDGTVATVGDNAYGQCDTGDWKDIVAITAGTYHTVGLKADGTVIAVGRNDEGQCDTEDWKDIVAVAAGTYNTVGLKSNGTVIVVGRNDDGQCNMG